MDKAQFVRLLAALLAGLQVPVSLRMPLGTATEPWRELFDFFNSFGWTDADALEKAIGEFLAATDQEAKP